MFTVWCAKLFLVVFDNSRLFLQEFRISLRLLKAFEFLVVLKDAVVGMVAVGDVVHP